MMPKKKVKMLLERHAHQGAYLDFDLMSHFWLACDKCDK